MRLCPRAAAPPPPQGLHADAKAALDAAARIQPAHWQTHMLRLHVLRRLGLLDDAEAEQSHRAVCARVTEACHEAQMPETVELICAGGRLLLTGAQGAGARKKPRRAASSPAAAHDSQGEEVGRFGTRLHSADARERLQRERYLVLRGLLPRRLLSLLQAFYAHLRRDVANTAVFQEKTQRHEYLPEILSTYFNIALVPFASKMSGSTVAPTYPFPITYLSGGGIHPHLDVSDNELSLTFQVQLEGPYSHWPLVFLDPRGQELSALNASTAKHAALEDNDGVLYYGPDIVHWREPQPSQLTQIVFAFREEDVTHCNNQ